MSMGTRRLTVAQAVVRFLANQYSERDGVEQRLIAGCFGIFGHGNVAGLGQALLEAEVSDPSALPYHQGRNEQAMVHASAAYARMKDRLSTFACTASVGPGATNMLTGAALATINRLPVLLLPGDIFATRVSSPVLQELEDPTSYDVSVNDAFRPVSRFFDRVWRAEQLPQALLGAMRVLTDPVETGAVTIALPQDVQAEAHDWPEELFGKRVWHVPRPVPEPAALARAVDVVREAKRPLIVAGGGVIYSQATEALREFVEATGIPVGQSQAGKGALPYDHTLSLGAIGSTGTTAANRMARDADVVIGIGTRYSDFTTASRTAFGHPDVRFVNVNVASFDVAKHAATGVVADAREALVALGEALSGWHVDDEYRRLARELAAEWDDIVSRAYALDHSPLPAQSEVIGVVNDVSDPRDVVVCAAGSMPGDLHKLWRTRDPKGYHVEYGYSCMGYEVAGGLGIRMACPDRDVFVMVGDGSYLMMAQELVTAVQEHLKIIVVLVQNHGFASIGELSETVGAERFGTRYRYRNPETGRLDGGILPVDLAANAESLGVRVLRARTIDEFRSAVEEAKKSDEDGPVMVHVETDPLVPAPSSESWWDVPVADVAELNATRDARTTYAENKSNQRLFL
ncbi:MAG TPA: 3D-(3,5/4)-trihydroxycyclohexane-1,2-dione acylhydrolase (decyclizing) [Jiangellaceae bacterium]|nr:3D-(3,5/4)-trihydroxycyclohexane-1,2-dione acylhydrolase (decyclizing) [Jiangellaceae bacterium]